MHARVCSRCDSRDLLYVLVLVQCNGSYNGSNGYDPCIFDDAVFNMVCCNRVYDSFSSIMFTSCASAVCMCRLKGCAVMCFRSIQLSV